MFDKNVYVRRRRTLLSLMKAEGCSGIVLFIGNVEAPAQYKDNAYKWRQDSSWLYFFGLDEPLYGAVLDLESGEQTVFADDVEIGDIIWMGPQPTVLSRAESVGIRRAVPYGELDTVVAKALQAGRPVHFLPPSRYYNTLKLAALTGGAKPSEALVRAVIAQRLVKEDCEIAAIDAACDLGYEMHTVARDAIRTGIVEQEIVGKMEGLTLSKGWGVSFPTILTQHGETLHNHLHDKIIEPGKLMVIDAGAESNEHYASDFTRTYPTGGALYAAPAGYLPDCMRLQQLCIQPDTSGRGLSRRASFHGTAHAGAPEGPGPGPRRRGRHGSGRHRRPLHAARPGSQHGA